MKLTKKAKAEVLNVYNAWLHSYLNGDVKTYDKYLDDEYHFIGSTNNEEFLNRKDTTNFFEATADQLAGKCQLKNEKRALEKFGSLVFVTHLFDAWFLNGKEWSYYGRFRFTSALQEKKEGWRFIYQHFSTTDSKAEEGETIGFDQISAENLQLREAVKRRTIELEAKNRELEVEGALERIRAQAVAMKESSDLLDIVVTMRDEFIKLGHEAHYFWHMTWLPEKYEKAMTSGDGTKIGFVMELPRHIHGDIPMLAKWEKSKRPTAVYAMNVEEALDYVDKMISLGDFQNIDPQAPSHYDIRHLGGLTFIMARTTHGEIGYSLPGVVRNPPAEDLEVLIQFARAFDLAHQRFLDLQKSEKQAREVQIELALEKVRSRTMAMQKSEELADVATVLFQQVKELGIPLWTCGFNIWDIGDTEFTFYPGGPDGEILPSSLVPLMEHPIFKQFDESRRRGDELLIYEKEGEVQKDHYRYMHSLPGIGDMLQGMLDSGLEFPDYQIDHVANFAYGNLIFITYEPFPKMHSVFKRFAKVFEQTYTRFLDLQKAEAQARESEIELALERVRARSMAMQKSDELKNVIKIVYQQLTHLKINLDHSGFVVDYTLKGDWNFWIADKQDIPSQISHPYFESVWGNQFNDAKEKGKNFFATNLNFDQKNKFYNELLSFIPELPKASKDFYLSCPGLAGSTVLLDNVGLYIENFEGIPYTQDENNILMRFGKAFQQTYTRFLDLQKAEAQAREAQIEAALERIRTQALAMRTSDDLLEVSKVLRDQMGRLGQEELESAIVHIYNENKKNLEAWYVYRAPEDVEGDFVSDKTVVAINSSWFTKQTFKKYKSLELEYTIISNRKRLTEWYAVLTQIAPEVVDYDKSGKLIIPELLYYHYSKFSGGALLMISNEEPSIEAKELQRRAAQVFDLAFRRFLDLQKAEAQAREAQIEAALERVRSRSMAMHKSEEMLSVIEVVSQQLRALNLNFDTVSFGKNDQNNFKFWLTSSGQPKPVLVEVPALNSPVQNTVKKAQKKGINFIADVFTKEENKKWCRHMIKYSVLKHFPKSVKDFILNAPGFARSSFLLKNIDLYVGNYRAVPFTDKENSIFGRFAQVFEQAYTRFLDLQKAEAQAREAQVEAAMERVRSRGMAMHQSEELLDVITVVSEQLIALGFRFNHVSFANNDIDENYKFWTAAKGKTQPMRFIVPNVDITMFNNLKAAQKKSLSFFTDILTKAEHIVWHKHLLKHDDGASIFSKEENDYIMSKGMVRSIAINANIMLILANYASIPYSEAENKIIERFGQVFEQSYTRFLDLQKAEAQARESQIEAALERVRSRSLAMHKPDELQEVITVVAEKLTELGVIFDAGGVILCTYFPDNKDVVHWIVAPDFSHSGSYLVPYFDNPIFKDAWDSKIRGDAYFYKEFPVEAKNHFFEHAFEHSDYKNFPDDYKQHVLKADKHNLSAAWSKNSAILIPSLTGVVPSKSDAEIMKRFAKVFEQAYIRFMDLQKAEAQAREAQIEAALERVRSKAMAMRSSKDISETTMILFKEIEKLEIKTMRCGILIIHQNKIMDVWTTSTSKDDKIIQVSGQIDMTTHPLFKSVYSSWKAMEVFTKYELKGQDGKNYYKALTKDGNYKLPNSSIIKGKHYNTWFNFKEGALFAFTKTEIPDESIKIFQRFAKVFGLTYQRYRELIESEKREKEAKKQASLDRVRGEIASMRSTEDLDRITPIIWQELTNLGVPFFRCGVFIMNEEKGNTQVYLSDPSGKSLGLMNLDYTTNDLVRNSVEAWRKNSVFKAHWSKEEFINWTKLLIKLGKIKTKKGYQGGDETPESLDLHFVPFSQGMLYVGNLQPLTDDQIELVKNLSESFSIAYARYEDFVKLEKAKESVETTLTELKTTQSQLIQSEKMASLGELTAGIAHEIQNPLNFVNNFSEVSKELLEEMMEEMQKGDMVEVKAIMDDIVQNLDKINHHGKRADGIVKGMLQHSRVSGDKKEPTDINKLADEYLRLAYHGLRAKDKSFNAQLVTYFDEAIQTIDTIPQDVGRVILNLVTNAFYAVSEKKEIVAKDLSGFQNLTGLDSYEPTVSISTKKNKNSVEIKVTDNGDGMPDHVKEKIFQPFFTTKPTGQGTGLGLSMSYDIITKGHGGELKVETKLGEGTEFIILLPV